MSTAVDVPRATYGGLLGSEIRRLLHRRVVRWLAVFAVAQYLLVNVIVWLNHDKAGSGHPAYRLGDAGGGAVGVGVGVAILMFVVGTTYAGAEWSQRTIVALLFWEPRRGRVISAKVLVAAAAAVTVTVVSQVVWLATAYVLAATKGVTTLPSGFWANLLDRQLRVLIFTVLVTWLGFGIANLVRNSAASLGVGFVYFVIVESVVQAFWTWATPYLLTHNAIALLSPGGWDIPARDPSRSPVHLSSLHGGLVWGTASLAILAVGTVVFSRSDAA
ncbi:MAG TPA: ABC transporter permease [Actinomycetes bacterium]|nr:ABC transporter permease [Actinomycetes bacterium]